MLEKGLIAAVNRPLPKELHHQSMTGASIHNNGTPDRYYDGPEDDLWVEYKMLKAMPRSGIAIGAYTAQQLHWMERRYRNGSNVVGIVGLPNRTACFQTTPEEWRAGTPIKWAMSLKAISALIVSRTCVRFDN